MIRVIRMLLATAAFAALAFSGALAQVSPIGRWEKGRTASAKFEGGVLTLTFVSGNQLILTPSSDGRQMTGTRKATEGRMQGTTAVTLNRT